MHMWFQHKKLSRERIFSQESQYKVLKNIIKKLFESCLEQKVKVNST